MQDEEKERINKDIDDLKKSGYNGLINASRFSGSFFNNDAISKIIRQRNDVLEVNNNQFKINYDGKQQEDVDVGFEIEGSELFYRGAEMFKNKKLLVEFLDKSKKVFVNSEMCFIPYTYKKDDRFYLLVINNILQNIEDYQLKSLNFINKQNNIYYIIETNKDERVKDLNSFKNYILKTCQKYVNHNTDLLYLVYPKIDNFKKDKAIVRQYNN